MSQDRAQDLIESYLARKLEGSAEPVDAFVAAHPEQADVLRRRLAQLERFGELVPAGSAPKLEVPRAFDGFEIVRELGRGGMGVVYEARQVALDRRVAIKVIGGGGFASARDRERFEREIHTLARISHPGIVKVFGSGAVGGSPYVAMELVEGEALSRRLPAEGDRIARTVVEAHVRLAVAVARALDHAHELGVVHRDVKPGNVLIDVRGDPVLIDFGLARDEERESITLTGQFVGTLSYTAPEQAQGERIDRRADVYGLGATLYHLVTGAPPYRARALNDLLRQLASGPPSSASRLNPALPRDLVVVLEHALALDPRQRYASCADFADDLERFLRGEPVAAQSPSTWSVLRQLSRRHRVFVASSAAAVAALVVGLIATLWQAQRATREAERATNEAQRVRVQREWFEYWFNETFEQLEPAQRVRAIERAEPKARELFGSYPDLLANTLDMLALRLRDAGASARAEALAQEALAIRETSLDEFDEDIVESRASQALLLQDRGDYEAAILLHRRVEEYYERFDLPTEPNALVAAHNRALCMLELDRAEEGVDLLRKTIDKQIAAHGDSDLNTLTFQNTLARWQVEHGQLEQGRATLEHIVELRRARPDDYGVDALAWDNNLGDAYRRSNDCARAIETFERVQAERVRRIGDRHPLTLSSKQNTAATMIGCGRAAEAAELLAGLVPVLEEELGPEDPDTIRALLHVAVSQRETKDWDAADHSARTVIERGTTAGEAELVASAQWVLGVALQERERWEESEAPLLESWKHFRREHKRLVQSITKLADHYAANGRAQDAERLRALLAKN